MSEDAKASLIGVSLDSLGKPQIETIHRDGKSERHPLESTKVQSETAPQTWERGAGALTKKADKQDKIGALTREEHVNRSVKVEAALLETLTTSTGKPIDLKTHAPAILYEMMRSMGGEWSDKAKELISN